jgi:predicted HD superfamily hydrolase involved in NAD metabolism
VTEKAILLKLRKALSPHRFRHTLSVARWAEALARLHRESPAKARLAGLLHDCAKEVPGPEQAALVEKWRLPVPGKAFILKTGHLGLLHAHVSAARAAREFGVKDRAVLSAVAAHTLGADGMSRLDRILYVADFSAPGRSYPEASVVRRLARRDLDAAFREVIRWKLQYVLKAGGAIHPLTVKLWNRHRIHRPKDG